MSESASTRHRPKRRLAVFVLLVMLLSTLALAPGCSGESQITEENPTGPQSDDTNVDPTPTIPKPDTLQGLDRAKLKALATQIRSGTEYPDIHSLLVMRNGVLVLAQYFNDWDPEQRHTMQSVSKSFTSAAIGIAISEGAISGVDELMVDFFPQWRDSLILDPRRAAMTVEDILTMRTGTDYNENGPNSPHFELNALRTGWDRYWLDRPMISQPGTRWQYDSGGVIALSAMLKDRVGIHADEYLQDVLFEPMGIESVHWVKNFDGHPHTGGGLYLRSVDMLKFGQLYLQRGRWDGSQIVPEAWVDESFQRRHTFSPPRGATGKTVGYGYLWWILAPDPDGSGTQNIYAAMGFRSQLIFVIPEHNMVVGVNGWMPTNQSNKPVEFLYTDILPAIIR
ncbi:serine hydrolase domain-containing protein [Bacteroidota bacterium]